VTPTDRLRGIARAVLRRPREPDQHDNVAYNRHLWDWYADKWRRDPQFRRDQADVGHDPEAGDDRFGVLGYEWGTAADLDAVIAEFIDPFIDAGSVAGEIGSGGGRVAAKVVDRVARLYCFDISPRMLEQARRTLGDRSDVEYVVLDGARLPEHLEGSLDFLYAFDVFVHLDLHAIWKYVQEAERTLRPGGHAFMHTANLAAPGGWANFAKQDVYRPQTHYFISPEIARTLVAHTGLEIVKQGEPDPNRFYLNRDYLFVVRKPK
jgi:SAM-dependent methyltransferase